MKCRFALRRALARLLAGLGGVLATTAADLPPPGTVLTNAAQIHALGATNAEQMRLPVRMRALCLGPSRYGLNLTVQDDTQAIPVYVNTVEERVPFGTLVEITGHTAGGRLFTEDTAFIRADSVRVLQTGVAPVPLPTTIENAAQFKHYRRWVAVEGVLLQTCFEDNELVVHVAGNEGWLIGRIRNWPREFLPTNWLGARVRFEGINLGFDRKPTQAIGGQATNHLQLLTSGRDNPFDAPLTNASALRAARSSAERARVHATVLYAGADGVVYLRDGETAFTSDPLYPFQPGAFKDGRYLPGVPVPKLRAGDRVELVGSPAVSAGSLRMRYAQTRVRQGGDPPEARPATLAGVAAGRHAADLVQVRGRLLEYGELPTRAGETTEWLRLEDGGAVVEVFLTSRDAAKLGAAKRDDLIEAVGLIVPSEGERGFKLRARSAADVRSLGLAPSVARQRTLRTAGTAALLLLAALGWIGFLRHRIARQRREAVVIREQNAALERRVFERTQQLENARQELARSLEHERELSELKSRFVSMVSHEFRTPLGITMSAVELLRNHLDLLDAAKRQELFDDIFSSTRHMAELMEQVLVLGRVEAGKLALRAAPVDLTALCEKLVDESLSATNRRCPIQFRPLPARSHAGDGAATAPATAHADESLLRHIISNLLSNAVKYSPAGTPVEFTLDREGANAVFTVRDRGIGIPEADRPKLFGAFHRAANVGDTPGTGLGLVIVKRCVELHGGHIEVQSKPGEGTTFTVRLPVFPSASSSPRL